MFGDLLAHHTAGWSSNSFLIMRIVLGVRQLLRRLVHHVRPSTGMGVLSFVTSPLAMTVSSTHTGERYSYGIIIYSG